jgi:vitamin B12 transporter
VTERESGVSAFVIIGAAAAALTSAAAVAQVETDDTIFVTGSRMRLASAAIGSAVSIVDRTEIEANQILLGKDILQDVPGFQVSNDRPGAVTSVYVRGADNDQVLVLMDGQELGDPSNIMTQFQFDHLQAAEIERIEILRGNQSSLYGSDAIGGVINIITRRPRADGLDLNLGAEAGSYGLRRLDVGVSGRSGDIDYRVSIGSLTADGPSRADPNAGPADEDDSYENLGLSGRLGVRLTTSLRLEMQGFASETDTELDGTGQDATFLPSVAKDESKLGLGLFHDSRDGRWHQELNISTYGADRVYRTSGDRLSGDKDNLRLSSAFDASDLIALALGFDHEEESTDQLTSFSGSFLAENETDSWFGELALTPIEALTLTFAARRDDNERFGAFDTYRVTAAWLLATEGPETKLRASWGTGAKAPGLYQLFDPSFGNSELGVEESEGYDIGVDVYWSSGALLEVSYFDNDLENEIDFAFPGGYLNRGRTRAKGVETHVAMPLGERIDWSLSYTYLDSRDRQSGDWLGRPRNAATTSISIAATSRLDLIARARYRSMNEASFGGTTNSFVVVDVLGRFALRENLEVYGRIVNLFDEDYQYEWGSSTYDLSAFAGVRIRY